MSDFQISNNFKNSHMFEQQTGTKAKLVEIENILRKSISGREFINEFSKILSAAQSGEADAIRNLFVKLYFEKNNLELKEHAVKLLLSHAYKEGDVYDEMSSYYHAWLLVFNKDIKEAVELLMKLKKGNFSPAFLLHGKLLENGFKVEKSYDLALKEYVDAGQLGHVLSPVFISSLNYKKAKADSNKLKQLLTFPRVLKSLFLIPIKVALMNTSHELCVFEITHDGGFLGKSSFMPTST